MDISGTKDKIQRVVKIVEESYRKISELLERMERLQNDLETTSKQVDHMEYELAEQRALLEALAEDEGIDVAAVLEDADLPPEPDGATGEASDAAAASEDADEATSRPSSTSGE
jgi:DNA anti-recombination protein RmuC